jgi:hypothetical protein
MLFWWEWVLLSFFSISSFSFKKGEKEKRTRTGMGNNGVGIGFISVDGRIPSYCRNPLSSFLITQDNSLARGFSLCYIEPKQSAGGG